MPCKRLSIRFDLITLFAAAAGLLLLGAGCQSRDRTGPGEGATCGAPGTNTVMLEDGCYCVVGHVLNASGDACVPEDGPAPVAPDGGVTPDAGPPETDAGPMGVGTVREVDTSDGNCAAGCAAVGFPCTTTCEEGAGWASYGYYDWDYGWYRSVHTSDLASCEAVPAPSYSEAGTEYELGKLVCCCEIPEVTVVRAAPGESRTCTEICVDEGHGDCAEFQDWANEDAHGGTLATYYRAATGSVTDVVMGCGAIPPATRHIAGADRTLRDFRCACY